jgi:branched-chain amino acid transport system substrate-binding protein
MKKPLLVLGAALAAGIVLVAADAQSKGTIKVVSQSPLSGGQSVLGEAIKNGVTMAVEEFGKTVTAYGFRFVYEPYDDQAKPDVGTANANRIINDADVMAVVGHLNSGVAIPSSEVYAKVGLPAVSPANTNPRVTDRKSTLNVMSRICGRDDVQGPAGADFVVNTLKAKKIFVINNKTAYGQGIADAFEARAKALGAATTPTAVAEQDTDFSAVLNRIVAEKPDAIYFGGIYDQVGLFIKQAKGKGVTVPIVGGDGFDGSDLQKIAGPENMKNVYFTTTSAPISALPAAKRFAEKYKAKFGKDPEGYSAYGYDAARVVIQGISSALRANKGAKPSREAVAKAIRAVKFNGITGRIEFNSRGDLPTAKYFIVQAAPEYADNKVIKSVSVAAPEPDLQ